MALKCDACGYENRDEALICNLCGKIFRNEKKRAVPPRPTSPAGTAPAANTASGSSRPRPQSIDGLDALGWHERGLALLQQSQVAAALDCYEKSLAIEPRFVKAWSNKATLLTMLGRLEEAHRCAVAALAIDPLYASAWFTKAVLEHNMGRQPQAMRSFQEVLSFPSDLGKEPLQEAMAAVEALKKAGIQPAEREALGWAAEGTLRGGERQFARALPCFDKAIALDPALAIAWHYRSCSLSKLDRNEEALASDDRALELEPANPELWHQKGLTLKNLHRLEEAVACYDRALELEARNPAYWSDRGRVLGMLDRHQESVASLERAIALAPNAAPPWLNKALSEEELGRLPDAIRSYERFLELASPDLLSHIQHAHLRIEALKARLAAPASPAPASAVAATGGGAPASVFMAGGITGEREASAPQNGQELLEEARALERTGRYEAAIDCLDQCLAADPARAEAWYVRGRSLQQLGELEEAIASLDRSIELEPESAEAWYYKGVSEQLSEQTAEAVRSLQKFLSLASAEHHRPLIANARHRLESLGAGSRSVR